MSTKKELIKYGFYAIENTVEDVLKSNVPLGWHPLVEKLIHDLLQLGWNRELHQIKEKFGGLRFYTGDTPSDCFGLILEAESQSMKTCEVCGDVGERLTIKHIVTTRCNEHKDVY